MPATLRPFHPVDTPGLYRVCLLTGDSGADASLLYRNPDLLGHVYAGPYVVADPGLCFVVVDDEGVGGYIVATADTAAFDAWAQERWWPVLRAQYPATDDPHDGTADHVLLAHVHQPPRPPSPVDAPAHLHINLLPRLQRAGWGRRLMEALVDELRARGVPGVHLDVDGRNVGGMAFYRRLGFVVIDTFAGGYRMARDLRT